MLLTRSFRCVVLFVPLSVERPDLDLTAVSVFTSTAINNLYGSPPSIDFYVSGRKVGEPVVAAETALLAANKDIVSFPVAASAVVPVYNLPGVDRTIPLLITRQVRNTGAHHKHASSSLLKPLAVWGLTIVSLSVVCFLSR